MQAQLDSAMQADVDDSISMFISTHPILIHAPQTKLPYTLSQISTRQIAQLNEPIIEPLLNTTPGLWMQTGALNTNRISLRGVGYREPFATTGIKIYLDEIPLTNGAGEASIEDIHPNFLSGIEIIRGPSSALWGAGLGGMILLKSQIPEEDQWKGSIQAGAYKRLQFDQNLSLRYGDRDQWGTLLHYQYLNDDGYRNNNEYRKYSMTWLQQWRSERWSLQSFLHGIALKAFIPSSISLADYVSNPQIAAPAWANVRGNEDYTKWISGISAGYDSGKRWLYRGSLFGTWFSSDEVRPFNVLDERNRAYGMRHRLAWQLHSSAHLVAGAELYREQYDASTFETLEGGIKGDSLTTGEDRRSYIHTFIQSMWNFGRRIQVFAGISTAWSELSNTSLSANLPASIFPTGGVQYDISPLIALSASLSRGYTAHSLTQLLNSDGTIPEDIKPETGWNFETKIELKRNGNYHATITAYLMHIENTIITRRIMDDQFEKLNGGKTKHRGIEISAGIQDETNVWSWNAAYTFNDHIFSEFIDNGIDYSSNVLPGIPDHRLYHTLSIKPIQNLALALTHHWVSDVFLNDANTISASGYHLLNASIDYEFKTFQNLKWIVGVHLHNFMDAQYAAMFQINAPGIIPRYYYPGKPRSVYFNAGFSYNL
jgi:iron complex outermembrane receptor protein